MSCSKDFSPDSTKKGHLPPLEVTKVFAFGMVVEKMEHVTGEAACDFLGMNRDKFIASQVVLKGGGHPTGRAVQKVLKACEDPAWYPGKQEGKSTGRPPIFSEYARGKCADVAMELKRKNIAPTPRRVRSRLPNLTINPTTGRPMCDKTMHEVYSTLCYDEDQDDPWQYFDSPSQDILPSDLLPKRVLCAKHILKVFKGSSSFNHVGFDPNYSLLPKTIAKLEELQVKAMGKKKWRSKKSPRTNNNLRAPSTAMTQSSASIRVDWTPVFARGKLRIIVLDPARARADSDYPTKLTDAENLSKFITNILPDVLEEMKDTHGWANIPRVIVHDKASYMVTHVHDRLNGAFARALDKAHLTSWIGDNRGTTSWLVPKWGDVYLHETVVSHIRRLLATDFARASLGETVKEFTKRVKQVENYMNSESFARAGGGRGLLGLAKELPERCQDVIKAKGKRIPK